MTIETSVANLTTETTALLTAVNVQKSVLDASVAAAAVQAGIAAVQATASANQAANAASQAALATTNGATQVALATNQTTAATTQATNAANSSVTAATAQVLATAQAVVSTSQAVASQTSAAAATAAKNQAESARDAAAVAGKVYDTTAAGLAATTNGQYFSVPSSLVGESLILYKNNAGAALESKRYPAAGFKRYMGIATPAMAPQVATDNYYLAVTPGIYTNFSGLVVKNEIAQLRYNGSAWVKEVEQNLAAPNSIVGEVVKGAFYPGEGGLMIAPGTVVKGYSATKQVFINIPAGLNPMAVDPVALDSPTGKLYCSLTGTLAITDKFNSELPAGEWVLLATCYDYSSGVNGLTFKPVIPSNHYFYGSKSNMLCIPSDKRTVSIKDLGAVGDGSTSDQQALSLFTVLKSRFTVTSGGQAPYFTATEQPAVLFFPAGSYLFTLSSGMNFDGCRFIGAGKSLTTLKAPTATASLAWNLFDLKDMTLQNIALGAFSAPTVFRMKNVRHLFDAAATSSASYTASPGTLDYEVADCDFDYLGPVYIALRCTGYRNVLIERNTFNAAGTGYASHAIRIENPATDKQAVLVRQNRVIGGTTGIFFGSSRGRPTSNCLVELNECLYQTEESIGFDGFGNNPSLCPVICNGLITSATNDSTGRLVIVASMKYHNGTLTNQDSPVSLRTDWTNYYFSLDEGSGRPGTLCKIRSANSATNEFTLEAYTPGASITVGGWVGVQSGFFDCAIRNNVITGAVGQPGAANSYATALSIYLNVFNFTIEGNTISNCANGINVAGGLMLSTYRCLAYNNVVKNNRFLNCNQVVTADAGVVRFYSYGTTIPQYNNQLVNNVIVGGDKIVMQNQKGLVYEGNQVDALGSVVLTKCGNTLPTANSSQIGKVFMKITDDVTGNLTTIDYLVCKLSGGVYSWVAL